MPKSVHTPAYKLFLQLLAGQRKRRKWSQRELGRRMNAHHAYVNLCESGERQLNVIELREWCGFLGISFPEFVRDLDESLKQMESGGAQTTVGSPNNESTPSPATNES